MALDELPGWVIECFKTEVDAALAKTLPKVREDGGKQ
jgi:hypothetical protein